MSARPSLLDRFRRTTFRRQISVIVALGIGAMALLSFFAISWQGSRQIRDTLISQGESLAGSLARQSQLALLTSSAENAQDAVRAALAFPDVFRITLFRADGTPLLSRHSEHAATPALSPESPLAERPLRARLVDESDVAWRFVAPVQTVGNEASPFEVVEKTPELLGFVAVELSKETLRTLVREAFILNFAVAVFFAVAFIWLLRRLMRRLTYPLAKLADVMEHAEAGASGVRAVEGGPRDVAVMAHAFNGMIAALEGREAELREARDAALQFARMKSHFAATMSHEIRTPLNGVIGALDMLKTASMPARQRDFVALAWDSSQYLLDLINNVLDFSRLEAGKLELELRPFDIRRSVEDVIDLLAQQAFTKGLAFGYIAAPEVPQQLIGDPRRIRQILVNLIGNAIKFTVIGEVSVRLAIAGEASSARLRIDVVDTGLGIDSEAQARIFDAYTQADTSTTRRFGGSGLGLSICRQLVELMGGTIGVASERDRGADFWFEIPLCPSLDTPVPARLNGNGQRVLVVDETESVRAFLEQSLGTWGYAVSGTARSDTALQMLRDAASTGRRFDLLIVDATMTAELPPRVRGDERIADMRIVAMCRLGSEVVSQQIDATLAKPLRLERLLQSLSTLEQSGTQTAPPDLLPLSVTVGWRVLVVEDNHTNQAIIRAMLNMLGCQVQLAENGHEAVQTFRTRHWDLVLMDCNMPVMDGYEATAAIRGMEHDASHRTPIVAMTANTQPGDIAKCLASGMDDHLAKPITLGSLTAKLRRWISTMIEEPQEESARASATPDLHAVDPIAFSSLREVLGSALPEAITPYLEDMPRYLDEIDSALAQEELEQLRRAVHAIKGASGNLGASRLATLAKEFEERVDARRLLPGDSSALLRAEYALVRESLLAEISALPTTDVWPSEKIAHVLIVDDDRSTRTALRCTLQRSGFDVSEAGNGIEALGLLERLTPDVILMDALMPEMDGFTACARIHEMPTLREIPILIITALEDTQSIERAFAAGASEYLTKPLHLSVVNQRVRRVIDARRAEHHVRHLAYNDALTGLPNRVMFTERLSRAIDHATLHGGKLAVLFLDLNRFKLVNDTLGHEIGDKLLIAVAERIRQCVRGDDCVSRQGGDEFTIMLDTEPAAADTVAKKIVRALTSSFEIDGHEISGAASIGISVFPDDGEDVSTLLRHADTAMYRAKRNNTSVAFYEAAMETTISTHLKLESDLRRALERDEFVVFYQPCADALTGHVISMEALVRWQHPTRGLIPPNDFIPLAEETGLIVDIGDRVLRAACRQTQHWRERGHSELRVAVNISGHQLRQPDFVDTVRGALRESGLPKESLTLEITESVLMEQGQDPVDLLHRLADEGIGLSIDDFGTGYSSLAYLKRFPVDVLKIDRSFIKEIDRSADDDAIVTGIIALAHSLRLKVVAEGVETEAQRRILRDRGCDVIQGYLIAKPLDSSVFEQSILLPERIG